MKFEMGDLGHTKNGRQVLVGYAPIRKSQRDGIVIWILPCFSEYWMPQEHWRRLNEDVIVTGSGDLEVEGTGLDIVTTWLQGGQWSDRRDGCCQRPKRVEAPSGGVCAFTSRRASGNEIFFLYFVATTYFSTCHLGQEREKKVCLPSQLTQFSTAVQSVLSWPAAAQRAQVFEDCPLKGGCLRGPMQCLKSDSGPDGTAHHGAQQGKVVTGSEQSQPRHLLWC
ncbi:hypothetical protein AVEN_60203-1 [Araneus ventricosus]|uniref:Uncharacterized protein n=1 Tax=Araneus ventricosus TaxID=182803 RepID=A0A4Y2CKT6_ARAVE|nr:hypothetical protein AVEN_60203-1 [Araneus ventricosus]